jgi:2-aminoadipate transaminase
MPTNTISLSLGHPDPKTLLTAELHSAMLEVINSPHAYAALQYGAEQGTRGLIDYLVEKLQREQNISIQAANLMIVAGSTGGVDMLARLYARPGGAVLVEAPTYVDSIHVFRDHQIELRSIPMDEDGLIPSELEKQLAQLLSNGVFPSMLYTIPNFHNPTGRTLPEARRMEIIRIAQSYGLLIVEDDVYRDLVFEGEVPASFYALAHGKQVFSIGSFSKTLAPGLRLGWLVGSEESIQYCVNSGVTQMGGGANPFVAHMVAEYCRSGAFEKHILRLQSLYKTRCDVALAALSQYMPADTKWTCPTGGFFIWLSLPENVFAQDVKRLALQEDVLVSAGEGFFVDPRDGEHNLRLAYSCAKPEDIEAGIGILAQVIEKARVE